MQRGGRYAAQRLLVISWARQVLTTDRDPSESPPCYLEAGRTELLIVRMTIDREYSCLPVVLATLDFPPRGLRDALAGSWTLSSAPARPLHIGLILFAAVLATSPPMGAAAPRHGNIQGGR